MAEPEKLPISPDLAEAFRNAVWRFYDWSGDDEPYVSVDKNPVLISAVCLRVEGFRGKLPGDLFQILYSCMHEQHRTLRMGLTQDPSYETAARCLFQLIEEKKARYQNRP